MCVSVFVSGMSHGYCLCALHVLQDGTPRADRDTADPLAQPGACSIPGPEQATADPPFEPTQVVSPDGSSKDGSNPPKPDEPGDVEVLIDSPQSHPPQPGGSGDNETIQQKQQQQKQEKVHVFSEPLKKETVVVGAALTPPVYSKQPAAPAACAMPEAHAVTPPQPKQPAVPMPEALAETPPQPEQPAVPAMPEALAVTQPEPKQPAVPATPKAIAVTSPQPKQLAVPATPPAVTPPQPEQPAVPAMPEALAVTPPVPKQPSAPMPEAPPVPKQPAAPMPEALAVTKQPAAPMPEALAVTSPVPNQPAPESVDALVASVRSGQSEGQMPAIPDDLAAMVAAAPPQTSQQPAAAVPGQTPLDPRVNTSTNRAASMRLNRFMESAEGQKFPHMLKLFNSNSDEPCSDFDPFCWYWEKTSRFWAKDLLKSGISSSYLFLCIYV